MSKRKLKSRIQALEEENATLNEDLDSIYDELQALTDRVNRWGSFSMPDVGSILGVVNKAQDNIIGAQKVFNGFFGPKPKINDEG